MAVIPGNFQGRGLTFAQCVDVLITWQTTETRQSSAVSQTAVDTGSAAVERVSLWSMGSMDRAGQRISSISA